VNNNLNKQVYQVYVKSFYDTNGDGYGDLRGVIAKLDYIKSLGTDIIWLSPIYPSPGVDGGYDISDYLGIDEKYGTPEDFTNLVKEADKRGMNLMLDIVVNHTSSAHKWFIESRTDKDNSKRDYYIWRKGNGKNPPNNWRSLFGPGSAWTYDEATDEWYLHLFAKEQPDLNWENVKVRCNVYDMMNKWIRRGVNGFRMDVITYLSKPENFPDALPEDNGNPSKYVSGGAKLLLYFTEMREKVFANGAALVIGEAAGACINDALRYSPLSRDALDAVFQFETNDLDGGESGKWNERIIVPQKFAEVLFDWQEKTDGKANLALFLSNHDEPRPVERFMPEVLDHSEFYDEAAKTLALFVYFMRGTPVVFNGDELGLRNAVFESAIALQDIESISGYNEMVEKLGFSGEKAMRIINKKARDTVRSAMPWDNTENNGFSAVPPWLDASPANSAYNVFNETNDNESVLNFYRNLFRQRKELPAVLYGNFKRLATNMEGIFAYKRKYAGECVTVISNFTSKETFVKKLNVSLKPFGRVLIVSGEARSV
jgi:oligo-1,6-glucosidase